MFLLFALIVGATFVVQAENRVVNLAVGYKTVNFTGKSVQGIAINNQIPGPTLHFVVLSDWIDTNPNKVFANLKKQGDFYSIGNPYQPSLAQFIRDYRSAPTPKAKAKAKILETYKRMQQS